MARRHQQLEDSLRLHKFIYDVEDEKAWMREREPLAKSTDLGNNLTSVQILLKKHQVCVGMCVGVVVGVHVCGSGGRWVGVHVCVGVVVMCMCV